MGGCQTDCCSGPDNHEIDGKITMQSEAVTLRKPRSNANLFEIVLSDQKQMQLIEDLVNSGISMSKLCQEISTDPKLTLEILSKQEKTEGEYQYLCLKDADLSFKAMEFSTLKYIGQVRMMPVYLNSDQSSQNDSGTMIRTKKGMENDHVLGYEYTKCGYGKLIWPDGSSFEGYWINGQAFGLGVFRTLHDEGDEVY